MVSVWILIGSFAGVQSLPISQFISFKRVSFKTLAFWVGIIIILNVIEYFAVGTANTTALAGSWCEVPRTALLFFAVMAAPIFEEPLYRGVLLRDLQTRREMAVILGISSALFAVTHYGDGVYGVLSLFLYGLVYGVAVLRTSSIVTTIVMHAVHNMIAFAFLAVTCPAG